MYLYLYPKTEFPRLLKDFFSLEWVQFSLASLPRVFLKHGFFQNCNARVLMQAIVVLVSEWK